MTTKYKDQLSIIADKVFCDKGLVGPSNKWSANNYVDMYEAYFYGIRDKKINILEIGIGVCGRAWNARIVHGKNKGGGASLKMWSEYFSNANIFAIDINDASHIKIDRVKTYVVDQGKKEQLNNFINDVCTKESIQFDIIIDDGSHRADHQQITLETLFPYLKNDGYYFIEDLNDHGYGSGKKSIHSSEYAVNSRDFFSQYKLYGNILKPNSFNDTSFLNLIDEIIFHSPRQVINLRDIVHEFLRLLIGKGKKGMIRSEFNPNSHKVLMLHKKRW